MKKIRRIPTILGLLILITGVSASLFLFNQKTPWFTQAEADITPKEVKITNIADTFFSVSWITDKPNSGFIKYGTDETLSFIAQDDRDQLSGENGNFITHHVSLKGLQPETSYFFKIGSGEKIFADNGAAYQVKTAPVSQVLTENDVAYGTILDQNSVSVEGIIVYLTLPNAITQSTITKSSGSWVIPLNLAISADLSSNFSYDRESSIEEIFIQGGSLGTATALAVTKTDNPIPAITLGGSYDFQEEPAQTDNQPIMPTPESQFPIETTDSAFSQIDSVSLANPSAGEIISTQKPEFFGQGPPNTTIKIEINSPTPVIGKVTIGSDGTWEWTPPTGLSIGDHTITLTLPDGKSLTRKFTVLAAGENASPAFTASPSGTLTPTPTTTKTPTPTPSTSLRASPTPTPTPTASATSQPGNLTPTFLIFIMGIGLIFVGLGGRLTIN